MALISLEDFHVLTNPYNNVMIEILLLHIFSDEESVYREGEITQLTVDWDLHTLSKSLEFLT